ncbi:MAG: chemotaxis protein CheW [Proteobacteria bacterium]|nr:chemotaxis protein CheW [Pseudomonadota bacterium]
MSKGKVVKDNITSVSTKKKSRKKLSKKKLEESAGSKKVKDDGVGFTLMPSSIKDKNTLRERAKLLSQTRKDDRNKHKAQTYFEVALGKDERYGIVRDFADEVFSVESITKVPFTPSFIAGVISLRGEMITVLDLNEMFGLDNCFGSEYVQIILVSYSGMTVGLKVNSIEREAVYVDSELASTLPGKKGFKQNYIKGIHQGKVALIDLEEILSDTDIIVDM